MYQSYMGHVLNVHRLCTKHKALASYFDAASITRHKKECDFEMKQINKKFGFEVIF